VLGERRNHYR
jgi:crooked neck